MFWIVCVENFYEDFALDKIFLPTIFDTNLNYFKFLVFFKNTLIT